VPETTRTRVRAAGDLGLIARANARRLLKPVYVRALRLVRRITTAVGLPLFARSMIDVDTLVRDAKPGSRVRLQRFESNEASRPLAILPGSDVVPELDGVQTQVSLLDIEDSGYSLRNGYLVDPEQRVLYESKIAPLFDSLRVSLVPLERPKRLSGTVAWLWNFDNYAHWLIFALPLLHYYLPLVDLRRTHFYVGSPLRRYQVESLELLGIPREHVIEHAVAADRTLVAIADRRQGYDSDFLLFADRHLAPERRASSGRRLYVSRGSAQHRRLLNEDECVNALAERFGVERVATSELPLADVIALFRGASLVVGPHGAGLTNAAFSPAHCPVVELAPDTFWDSIYAQLASVKGQRYGLLRGPASGGRARVQPSWQDFEVDVDKLVAFAGAALDQA
jgi:hypothetical protein